MGHSSGSHAASRQRPRLRCAIYTRKSTEDGLEQAFNSLDAQREACEAYVVSQASLGWKALPDRYNDGGLSGGSMQRPALQQLLKDVRDGGVDIVVVYKIDRLTRSLMDFARMVEIFDAAKVSFVSVTQQFNTTSSMGRLTLNVLLSFAQFEREVTAERIRDKIAASKRKGMWMGGTVPFGYRIEDRRLVVEPNAAAEVVRLFERYLALGSVPALARELNRDPSTNGKPPLLLTDTGQGRRRPSTRIGTGKLYYMLSNPIYTGRIRHGGALHAGEHDAIVEDGIFAAVAERLAEQAPRPRGSLVQRDIHLLRGLIFDESGSRLGPIHVTKAGKRYRYYVSTGLLKGTRQAGCHREAGAPSPSSSDRYRLPAAEIEAIVLSGLRRLMADHPTLASWMEADGAGKHMKEGLLTAERLADHLDPNGPLDGRRDLVAGILHRVEIADARVRILVSRHAVVRMLTGVATPDPVSDDPSALRLSDDATDGDDLEIGDGPIGGLHLIEVPMTMRRRGVARRLVIEGPHGSMPARTDRPLIEAIARAHAYRDALCGSLDDALDDSSREAARSGADRNHRLRPGRKEIADRFGVHPEDVSRLLPLAFLSPTIVEAILTGRQPADLSVQRLTRGIDLPVSWAAQGKLLGF